MAGNQSVTQSTIITRATKRLLVPLAGHMADCKLTAGLAKKASRLSGSVLSRLGWQQGASLEKAASKAMVNDYAALVNSPHDFDQLVQNAKLVMNRMAEIHQLLPGNEKASHYVELAFARWVDAEATFEKHEQNIQRLIDLNYPDPLLATAAAKVQTDLVELHEQFYAIYDQLGYEELKTFKRFLDIHLVLKHTPKGVQEQQEASKYIFRGKDGQWHLKPEAMEITFTPEMVEPYSKANPNGHNLKAVIKHKGDRYAISTAGYRDRQNPQFPWDGNSNFGFFEEAITAYSQNLTMALMSTKNDAALKKDIALLKELIQAHRTRIRAKDNVKDAAILANLMNNEKSEEAAALFTNISAKMEKLAGGEVRFNTDMYQELFVRISAAMGMTVHTPKLEGLNKTSIWMASFLIFTKDYDGGNFLTSSHARANYACSKDLSDEGAQFLPEVSLSFAAANQWVIDQIANKGEFKIKVAAADDQHIVRDVDGKPEYLAMLKTSVLTPENEALVKKAIDQGYSVIQDCAAGCMGPIMRKLFEMAGIDKAVKQINTEYDPFQAGIGKAVVGNKAQLLDSNFKLKAELPKLVLEDEGCDASLQLVVERMDYKHHLKDEPIGRIVTNTDPDGDRLVVGQIMANNAETKAQLGEFGIKFIEIDNDKLFCYYSPNKMFLMSTAYYLNQLVASGKIVKGDTAVAIKTAQTSYAFNEFAASFEKKHGIKVVCIEPTVGFKEIAAAQRDLEMQIKANKAREAASEALQDVVVTDALGHEINLGTGRIVLVTASEESGGQESAPPGGITSGAGRYALGNREKSAGVGSFLSIIFGADLHLQGKTVLQYWQGLIDEYGLTFTQDERHDEKLFDPGILDPKEYQIAEERGNQVKQFNNRFWWNLARSFEQGALDLEKVRSILVETFPALKAERLMTLKEIKPVLTAGKEAADRAKDGVYLLFGDFYIAIRPSGTDPKIKGYYSGTFKPTKGLGIAEAMAGYAPEELAEWEDVNYYKNDPFA